MPLQISKSKTDYKGLAVYNLLPIKKNTVICTYMGEFSTNEDLLKGDDSVLTIGYF